MLQAWGSPFHGNSFLFWAFTTIELAGEQLQRGLGVYILGIMCQQLFDCLIDGVSDCDLSTQLCQILTDKTYMITKVAYHTLRLVQTQSELHGYTVWLPLPTVSH